MHFEYEFVWMISKWHLIEYKHDWFSHQVHKWEHPLGFLY